MVYLDFPFKKNKSWYVELDLAMASTRESGFLHPGLLRFRACFLFFINLSSRPRLCTSTIIILAHVFLNYESCLYTCVRGFFRDSS
jgi:hypothetical protein